MKKSILPLLLILWSAFAFTQQRALVPQELLDRSVRSDYVRPHSNPEVPGYKSPNSLQTNIAGGISVFENILGNTFYDLQSNASLSNRIHYFDDGTISAVWTMGNQATAFPDRGTGYNYFDGNAWGPAPAQRIETFRSGWPSIAPWGGNGEIVVSHDFSAFKLYFNSRPQKGTGAWTQTAYEYSNGPTTLAWPRMATSGEDHNTIHLLASTYGEYLGQTVGMVYSRSLDGGVTWDIENAVPDGMGSDYYLEINADQYIWSNPVGDTIAFLVASAWHDLFMMKSTDNGESWEKTVIWEHPYPFFDWNVTITDTFFCVDNSASIALDSEGKAHVAFGISRVIHEAVGTTYNYFPGVDGIGYWNEDMPAFSNDLNALAPPQYGYDNTEMVEDVNYIGWTQDVDGDGEITFVNTVSGFPMSYREMGISTMPAITIAPGDMVAVVWSSTTETYDNFDYNFKKLWMRYTDGMNWSPFEHLTQDIVHIFDESIYPCADPSFEEYIHLIYNNDGTPGTALDGDHDYQENRATYMRIEIYPIGIGEKPVHGNPPQSLFISPNPTRGLVKLAYSLTQPVEVYVVIRDVTGKEVSSMNLGWRDKGDYNQTLDLGNLEKGVYFVSLLTSNGSVTQRVVRQ
jgi:hypothetical protein